MPRTINPHNIGSDDGELVTWTHQGPDENANVVFDKRSRQWSVEFVEFSKIEQDWFTTEVLEGTMAIAWMQRHIAGPLVT